MHVSFQAWNEGEDPRGSRRTHPAVAEVDRLLGDEWTTLRAAHRSALSRIARRLVRDTPALANVIEPALRAAYAEAWHAGQRAGLEAAERARREACTWPHADYPGTRECVCVTKPARAVESAETASELLDRAVALVRSQVGASANVTATLYVSVDTDGPNETDEDVKSRG